MLEWNQTPARANHLFRYVGAMVVFLNLFTAFLTGIGENVNMLKDKIDSWEVLVAVLWSVLLCVLRPSDLRTVVTGHSAHAIYSTQ